MKPTPEQRGAYVWEAAPSHFGEVEKAPCPRWFFPRCPVCRRPWFRHKGIQVG